MIQRCLLFSHSIRSAAAPKPVSLPAVQQIPDGEVPAVYDGTRFIVYLLVTEGPPPATVWINSRTPVGPLGVVVKAGEEQQGEMIHM